MHGILLSLIFAGAASGAFPYQECDWKNKPHTDRLTKRFAHYSVSDDKGYEGGDVPGLCFLASAVWGGGLWGPRDGGRAYYHCVDGRSQRYMSVIDEEGRARTLYTRSFCFNEDHMALTGRAFNDVARCFELSDEEKKYFFALFNHESAFHLNKRSETGARCFGQLTMDAISEVHRSINWKRDTLWEEARGRCPGLESLVVPAKILGEERLSRGDIRAASRANRPRLDCHLTHNPYACLFYSVFFMKIYEEMIKRVITRPISAGTLNAQFGQVITVQGRCVRFRGAADIQANWLFANARSAAATLSKCHPEESELRVETVDVFADFDRDIKLDVLLTSYNGGSSIIVSYFPAFLRMFKESLARRCPVGEDSQRCAWRATILGGEPLSGEIFYHSFQNFLLEHYLRRNGSSVRRRREVANFSGKIIQHLKVVSAKGESRARILRRRMSRAYKYPIGEEEFDDFVADLRASCSMDLHRNWRAQGLR